MINQYHQILTISIPESLLPSPPPEVLFLDIETTGLSPDHAFIYLIGCIYYKEKNWNLLQFFIDTPKEESDLLRSFFAFAINYHSLIHYNGDHFDLPFLKKRAMIQQIPITLPSVSLDLYKELRPFQTIFQLKTMKQQDLEHYLNFHRENQNTGKEQIQQYSTYLNSKDPTLRSMLLLHNAEDLKGMLLILTLRSLPLLKNGYFQIQKTIFQTFSLLTKEQPLLVSRLRPIVPLPISIFYQNEFCTITTQFDNSIQIKVPVFQGILKYFYLNYKDYYYLPEEDYAIHKSIASYVDSAHRIKAKASNCYIKKEGYFLKQPTPFYQPEFKQDHTDPYGYFEITEEFLNTEEKIKAYLLTLLSKF